MAAVTGEDSFSFFLLLHCTAMDATHPQSKQEGGGKAKKVQFSKGFLLRCLFRLGCKHKDRKEGVAVNKSFSSSSLLCMPGWVHPSSLPVRGTDVRSVSEKASSAAATTSFPSSFALCDDRQSPLPPPPPSPLGNEFTKVITNFPFFPP